MDLNNPQVKIEIEKNNIDCEGRQPPPTIPTTKALSDGSRDETPSPTYKHSWTIEQRVTLATLAETYVNTWKEITLVFNYVHRSDLRRCGGLRSVVISTQYNDMLRRGFDVNVDLKRMQATLPSYSTPNLVTRTQLEQKADEIGIKLITERTANCSRRSLVGMHDPSTRKRKRIETDDDARTDFLPDRIHSQTASYLRTAHSLAILPKTPQKNSIKTLGDGLQTPPNSRQHILPRFTAAKRLAKIGFRAFTSQSQGTYDATLGIRAGAFLKCPSLPLARDLEVTRYREEALHHIKMHDHSRPSMFISATKNPMRALHLLLHAPQGEKTLILIDLNAADANGNVQKARDLKIQTAFGYTPAGEYLIFGGVGPEAIISQISLSSLLSRMPTTPSDDDPLRLQILQSHEKLSSARYAMRKEIPPMTYALGMAVDQLVGNLRIPPKLFETGVWAFVQDFKFYNAEGGTKRGHWANNLAFRDGAVKGYQSVQSNTGLSLAIGEAIDSAREVIVIEDDSEPDQASDEDDFEPIDVADWVQKTQPNRSYLQHFDHEKRQWTVREEGLGDNFVEELRKMAGTSARNCPELGGHISAGDAMDISQDEDQMRDIAGKPRSSALNLNTISVIEKSITVPAVNAIGLFSNLDELCKDVMLMHKDEDVSPVQMGDRDTDYEFGWTGM